MKILSVHSKTRIYLVNLEDLPGLRAVFLGLNTVGAVEATRNNLVVGLQWTAPGGDSYLGTGQFL
jgi:hypothetical protein